MSRICYPDELPKPCQECEHLHCSQWYMEGKGCFSCFGGEDVSVHFAFNKGICCKETDQQESKVKSWTE